MKRVLIITYYFPPAGGPGVQRVLKFVRYLRDFGWEPLVLTVEEGAFPKHDASLKNEIPDGVGVYRTASWDPFRWYARLTGKSASEAVKVGSLGEGGHSQKEQLARWIRANLFLPDARVGWMPFALKAGLRLIKKTKIEAIFTSGPPHSVHLTGLALRRFTGVPWLADFRDPWTDINYYHELPHTSFANKIDTGLERIVLRNADKITTVSPSWRQLLASKTKAAAHKTMVVQNGYDETDFQGKQPSISEAEFVVSYIGSLYASRNPVVLWDALSQLKTVGAIPDLRLRLVGTIDKVVQQSIRDHDIADLIELEGYVQHERAIRVMQESTLLLLVIEAFKENAGMITGKLYEYLAAGRPVLAIGPIGGDAEVLLRETSAGVLFGHQDEVGIAAYIRRAYKAWATGAPEAGSDATVINQYSRKAQTALLAKALNEICPD